MQRTTYKVTSPSPSPSKLPRFQSHIHAQPTITFCLAHIFSHKSFSYTRPSPSSHGFTMTLLKSALGAAPKPNERESSHSPFDFNRAAGSPTFAIAPTPNSTGQTHARNGTLSAASFSRPSLRLPPSSLRNNQTSSDNEIERVNLASTFGGPFNFPGTSLQPSFPAQFAAHGSDGCDEMDTDDDPNPLSLVNSQNTTRSEVNNPLYAGFGSTDIMGLDSTRLPPANQAFPNHRAMNESRAASNSSSWSINEIGRSYVSLEVRCPPPVPSTFHRSSHFSNSPSVFGDSRSENPFFARQPIPRNDSISSDSGSRDLSHSRRPISTNESISRVSRSLNPFSLDRPNPSDDLGSHGRRSTNAFASRQPIPNDDTELRERRSTDSFALRRPVSQPVRNSTLGHESALRVSRPLNPSRQPVPPPVRNHIPRSTLLAMVDDMPLAMQNTGAIWEDCVCAEEYTDEHPAVELSCRHVIGKQCLKKWVTSRNKGARKCPLCRAKIIG